MWNARVTGSVAENCWASSRLGEITSEVSSDCRCTVGGFISYGFATGVPAFVRSRMPGLLSGTPLYWKVGIGLGSAGLYGKIASGVTSTTSSLLFLRSSLHLNRAPKIGIFAR